MMAAGEGSVKPERVPLEGGFAINRLALQELDGQLN
jgi:hypothetical protein